MGRTACTEPQCLYKGAIYLLFFNIKHPLGLKVLSELCLKWEGGGRNACSYLCKVAELWPHIKQSGVCPHMFSRNSEYQISVKLARRQTDEKFY